MQRTVIFRGAIEHVGVMGREYGGNEDPRIDQRERRKREVSDPVGAGRLLQGDQRLHDGDQAQQSRNGDDDQNDRPGLILFSVPQTNLLGSQAHHEDVDQDQE